MHRKQKQKTGFITILGRPNVGKSTLLNGIIGENLASVSPKPQTTRRRFRGIHTEVIEGVSHQMVFSDTPGLHVALAKRKLNAYCVQEALAGLKDGDIILYMIDRSRPFLGDEDGSDEKFLLQQLRNVLTQTTTPLFVILNKLDLPHSEFSQAFLEKTLHDLPVKAILPMIAKRKKGIAALLEEIRKVLPEAPHHFSEDSLTDESTRNIAREYVQEQLFYLLGEELPYDCSVEITNFREPRDKEKKITIEATIHVDKNSQKQIVIGLGGAKIKSIGIMARRRLEEFLQCGVVLKLLVKVTKNWVRDSKHLEKLGYVQH